MTEIEALRAENERLRRDLARLSRCRELIDLANELDSGRYDVGLRLNPLTSRRSSHRKKLAVTLRRIRRMSGNWGGPYAWDLLEVAAWAWAAYVAPGVHR